MLAHHRADVHGRGTNPHLGADFHPLHHAVGGGRCESRHLLVQCLGTLRQQLHGHMGVSQKIQAAARRLQRGSYAAQRRNPGQAIDTLGRAVNPGQTPGDCRFAKQCSHRLNGLRQAAGQPVPIGKTALGPLGLAQQVRGQTLPSGGTGLHRQKLQSDGIDLVRFVEHHHTGAGKQLGHTRLADLQIGKKQVVVDHHHIGTQGSAAGCVDMALRHARACCTQAVFTG